MFSLLNTFSLFLNSKAGAGIASAVFGIIGALVFIAATLPPFLETFKSRKTFAIHVKFFLFSVCSSSFFLLTAIFLIVNNAGNVGTMILGGAMCTSNLCALLMNFYMFKIKTANMKAAREKNMTETDYYNNVLLPSMSTGGSRRKTVSQAE